MKRGRSLTGALALAALSASVAAEVNVDHRFAPRAETLLPMPSFAYQAVVTADGTLRYGDGVRLSVAATGDLSPPRGAAPAQKLLGSALPIVVTTTESDKLSLELTAFAAASPAMDCLRAVVRNKTAGALSPVIRVTAHGAHGLLPPPHSGFHRGGAVLALCGTREGKSETPVAPAPKRHVFQQRGGKPLPNWGKPKVACDPGFRHIVAGFEEPATFRLKAEAGKRYVVAFGLCESHWKTAGNRICDLRIEGEKVATVDPVAKPYGADVPFVLTFPATDRNNDGWVEVTSVASRGSPDQNSIINVIWLFEQAIAKGLQPADILSGGANDKAACYVDCGGGGAASPTAASTLDFRFDLQPNASATLWVRKPHASVKIADAAGLADADGAKLLASAEQAWTEARAKANWITLSDPAPCDSLFLAYVNLRCLCSREGDAAIVRPEPFSTAFSPRACAWAAGAFDRLGAHPEAAAILAGLVARQGEDHLWAEGSGCWVPTGQVLFAFAFHYSLTGDRAWLEANYRPMLSAADAILDARELTKWVANDPDAPIHGLMPSAAYGDVPPDQWLEDSAAALTGLSAVVGVAGALDKRNDLLRIAENRREMWDAFFRTAKREEGQWREAKEHPVAPLAEEAAVAVAFTCERLVSGQGAELHLLSNVPKTWLSKGIVVNNLPTAFGPVSYKATLSPDGSKLIVESQFQARRQPKAIVVHPPMPAGDSKPLTVTDFRGGKLEVDLK